MIDLLKILEGFGQITIAQLIQYGIPIFSLIVSLQTFRTNKRQLEKNNQREKLNEVKKVFPLVYDSEPNLNHVKIFNRSDYPVFDVVIGQGINTMNLSNGDFPIVPIYIRCILPATVITCKMKNYGLGMCKFLVAGMFFRDYLGNEWFRDSYGKFQEARNYKKLLIEKKKLIPPYMNTNGCIIENIISK